MTRRKRLKALPELQRRDLIATLEKQNSTLVEALRVVAPSGDEYRAISALQDSVIATIRALGEEPSWMRPRI